MEGQTQTGRRGLCRCGTGNADKSGKRPAKAALSAQLLEYAFTKTTIGFSPSAVDPPLAHLAPQTSKQRRARDAVGPPQVRMGPQRQRLVLRNGAGPPSEWLERTNPAFFRACEGEGIHSAIRQFETVVKFSCF